MRRHVRSWRKQTLHRLTQTGVGTVGCLQTKHVREGYPEQRTASVRRVDGMNVRDSRVHNYLPRCRGCNNA
jgi:hypothetical protein